MALVTRRDILRGCETFVSSCTVLHLMVTVCWLLQVSEQYCNASLCWVQEEHKNMGAWSYVQPRTQTAIGGYHRSYTDITDFYSHCSVLYGMICAMVMII